MPPAKKEKKEGAPVGSLAPATIIVSLPADAKLLIDGAATTSTSALRTLESPALQAGMDHHYTLTAELVQDGKPVTATKRITVRAGEETRVALDLPVASVAQR
jgi:uncharacterized protein (TIGR03000 family)